MTFIHKALPSFWHCHAELPDEVQRRSEKQYEGTGHDVVEFERSPSTVPFALTISERGHSWAGRPAVRSVHDTREQAKAALLDYVRRNWNAEVGTAPPEPPDEMIAAYFEDVLEAYEISERETV